MTTFQIIFFSVSNLTILVLVILIKINQQETRDDIDTLLDEIEVIQDYLELQPTVSFTMGPVSEQN